MAAIPGSRDIELSCAPPRWIALLARRHGALCRRAGRSHIDPLACDAQQGSFEV
jgi:hypothetical protein